VVNQLSYCAGITTEDTEGHSVKADDHLSRFLRLRPALTQINSSGYFRSARRIRR